MTPGRLERTVALTLVMAFTATAGAAAAATAARGAADGAAASVAPAAGSAAAAEPEMTGEHHIGVRVVGGRGELFDRRSGETFVVRGANYVFREDDSGARPPEIFRVGRYTPERVRRDFERLAAHGYNTVRVFLDLCDPQDEGCIGVVDGEGLNPAYLANVADLTQAARDAGLYVLFTSNDLPDHGGYSQRANAVAGPNFAGYRNAFYLTPEAVDATRRYWRDIITGLHAFGAPLEHVLAWQLLNEQWMFADQPPLSLREGHVTTTTGSYDMADPEQRRAMVADGIVHYVAEMKAEIRAHDPTALVTMGFFAPGAAPGWYTDPVDALARADLDLLDFHAYPGSERIEDLAERFAVAEHPEKPIILGEYGALRFAYPDLESAASAIAGWQSDACRLGFDGWLYWAYAGAHPSIDDATWGLADADGFLLELLSPAASPDPCDRIDVPLANKAIGSRARASQTFEQERPSRAIDGNADTTWISGSDPPQWIRVELPQPVDVAEVQLVVSQHPAGMTRHVIELRRGRRDHLVVAQLRGRTRDEDVLVRRFEPPIRGVTSIRLLTTRSPSWVGWREVRLFEEPQPDPGDLPAR